ncbi:MAG: HXXEE domain-containing protein [Solirubrobacterales bacterium]
MPKSSEPVAVGDRCDTHGRWPLVAATGLIPVVALSVSNPRLRPLAALFAHQTEEWVWPGGFLPWINETVIGSDHPEFPIDRKAGFVINVLFGWGLSLSTLAGPAAAVPQTALFVSHIGNAGLHVGWAARHRQYDPGFATSLLSLMPTGILGLRRLGKDPEVSRMQMAAGVASGLAIAGGMFPLMKKRLNHRLRGS